MGRAISLVLALSVVNPPVSAAEPTWSRVGTLHPGTAIIVITKDSPAAARYFIAADDAQLTSLNLTNLPTKLRDVLRQTATDHPTYFTAARSQTTFQLERKVQIGPDGVFLDGHKIGELRQILETTARDDISTLTTAAVHRSRIGCGFAGYGGWFLGGIVGATAGMAIALAVGTDSDAAAQGALLGGTVAGGIAGSVWVYRKCLVKPEQVIYFR
jgi:hypothetical protein